MALTPRESERNTRLRAVRYIGLMGADSSVETLIKVMNRYPETRDTAATALTRLTGLHLGNSSQAWTRWFVERKKAQEEAQKKAPSQGLLGIISAEEKEPVPPEANDPQEAKRPSQ